MNQPSRPRAILSEAQAIEIFHIKLVASTFMHACPSPNRIASSFGVSEKAVRDIWKGRTWARETHHLDPTRPAPLKKCCGRPRGSKDSRPRNLGLPSGVRRPSIDLEFEIAPSIDICTDICSSQRIHAENISEHRHFLSTSDSVDHQLHEWTEGISAPSELVDPFQLDWVEWVAAADRINEDL